MKKKTKTKKAEGYIIINPSHKGRRDNNLQLLRVTVTNEQTKIDFGYQTTSNYIKGGWVRISPQTFIQPIGSQKKYSITNASNIPYGPEQLEFKSTIDWLYFSLIFPPLPAGVEEMDLIENERGDATDFNFFRIKLNEKEKITKIL